MVVIITNKSGFIGLMPLFFEARILLTSAPTEEKADAAARRPYPGTVRKCAAAAGLIDISIDWERALNIIGD